MFRIKKILIHNYPKDSFIINIQNKIKNQVFNELNPIYRE